GCGARHRTFAEHIRRSSGALAMRAALLTGGGRLDRVPARSPARGEFLRPWRLLCLCYQARDTDVPSPVEGVYLSVKPIREIVFLCVGGRLDTWRRVLAAIGYNALPLIVSLARRPYAVTRALDRID